MMPWVINASFVGAQPLRTRRQTLPVPIENIKLKPATETRKVVEPTPARSAPEYRHLQCDRWTFENGLASYLRMTFLADPEGSLSKVYAENLTEQSSALQVRTPLIGWQFFGEGSDTLSPIGIDQSKQPIAYCEAGMFEYQKSYRTTEGYPHDSFYSICVPKDFYSMKRFPVKIHEYKAFLSGDRENHFLPTLQCSSGLP